MIVNKLPLHKVYFKIISNIAVFRKLWDVVRKITEKKGGIQGLMK